MGDTATSLLKNRYALHELIGQGGMAAVYRATDTALGREVAIKVFAASDADIEGAAQEDEVNVLASLSHHSLVTLLDAGVDRSVRESPRVFLVMEYVRGSDLQRALARGPLTPRQIGQIGYDLAEGLAYIHRRGVIHRDIKPSNILLADYQDGTPRERAMLTDFGIAHRGVQRQNREATTTGTAAYLSPEQVRRDDVGPPSDVYSLGLVLLECFTAQLAYPGAPTDSAMSRLIADPAMPETLSTEWRALLSAMTARDPRQRPLASDLVLALRDLSMLETGRHREADPAPRVAGTEQPFHRVTTLASRLLSCPVAIVSIIDTEGAWFPSHYGLTLQQLEAQRGLSMTAVYVAEPGIVDEIPTDARALANDLVAGKYGPRVVAGVPLTTYDGYNLGTLCVLDRAPRAVSEDEIMSLIDLGAMVMSELELRLANSRPSSNG